MADETILHIAEEVYEAKDVLDNEALKETIFNVKQKLKETIGIDVPEETIVEVAALFALDDEKFEVIGDAFIDSFEKTLNTTENKIQICQSLNIANLKAEDMLKLNEDWITLIDTQFIDQFSKVKRSFLKKIFAVLVNLAMDSQGINKRVIQIPILLSEGAYMPKYANPTDAGADVICPEEVVINPGETVIVKTGIKVEIPKGYEIQVRPRSGLSAKSKLRIANTPGTIDSGYRDEIGIICENIEPKIKDIDFEYNEDGSMNIKSVEFGSSITIEKGQRIAQLVLSEVPVMNFIEVDTISDEGNRNGGFGSTGV